MYNGLINIYKEAGYTSNDVVAKMRGICGQRKIGHTGTLDPQATGVLPVCLGSGTKLCELLTDHDKEYVAELLLGVTTDTQDTTGTILSQSPVTCTEAEVRAAVESFRGEYDQIPPMYSALKVNGKKLYDLARAGIEVERKARRVTILELEILEMRLPVVKFRVTCTKGTYIRTLCADIGDKLGCGGTMQSLIRTRVGRFRLEDSITLDTLQTLRDTGRLTDAILPVESVFADSPVLHVRPEFTRLLDNGNPLTPSQTLENCTYPSPQSVRLRRPDETFVGIYIFDETRKYYKPLKMFLESQ